MRSKKITIIGIIFLAICLVTIYKIRNRPFDKLNSLLETNYPALKTEEAKHACDEIKLQAIEISKFSIKNYPSSWAAIVGFAKSNNLFTKTETMDYTIKKFNIKNSDDIRKTKIYISKAAELNNEMMANYIGLYFEERNFIEKYLFLDF